MPKASRSSTASRQSQRGGKAEYTPRLFASVCGLEGAGKTKFACSAPGRVLYLATDPNSAETVQNEQEANADLDIDYHQFDLPGIAFGGREEVQPEAEGVWSQFINVVRPIVKGEVEPPSVIVLDTATEFWTLLLLADHGKSVQILPDLRTKSNARYQSLLAGLKQTGAHVLLLHRLGPHYESRTVRGKNNTSTEERVQVPGEYDRQGFSKTGFSVNVEAFLFHNRERDEELSEQFGMKIVRCTSRPSLIDREVWGTDAKGRSRVTFAKLFAMVYPDA